MITVCAMLWDANDKSFEFSQAYNEEWAVRLYDGFARNFTVPFKMALFVDREREFDRPIEQHLLTRRPIDYGSCIEPYKLAGPKIVVGLDTVITGNIDHLAKWAIAGKSYLLPRDPYNRHQACNGVAVCPASLDLWTDWNGENDMDWCRSFPHQYLDDVFPGDVVSYKGHVREKGIEGTKIVYFHGNPKMHQLPGIEWVAKHWGEPVLNKIAYIEKLNNDDTSILQNVTDNIKRDLSWFTPQPKHDRQALIVGGGPSLEDTLPELRKRRHKKAEIFALNGVHDYLRDRNIPPDYHMLLDSRADNTCFVQNPNRRTKYMIAAQCHPDIFDALTGYDVTLWFSDHPGTLELVDNITEKPVVLVGGGNTVGLKTMYVAYLMGYRRFHLYGFDSCYRGDENHAYPQPLNASESVQEIYAAGRKFYCAPWMSKQADWFQEQMKHMLPKGCEIAVHGDGLIAHIVKTVNEANNESTRSESVR